MINRTCLFVYRAEIVSVGVEGDVAVLGKGSRPQQRVHQYNNRFVQYLGLQLLDNKYVII